MKKLLIAFLFIILLSASVIYLFIPNTVEVTSKADIICTQDGLYRTLLSNRDWSKWWPGQVTAKNNEADQAFKYNDRIYEVTTYGYGVLMISITDQLANPGSSLTVTPKARDTIQLEWKAEVITSYNPARRIQTYLDCKHLEKDMSSILGRIQTYFSKTANIYSADIQVELLKDSFLLSTSSTSKSYPTLNDIYSGIHKLQKHIAEEGAKEAGYPMLNLIKEDSSTWIIKVAVPTNVMLGSSGDMLFKAMPGRGKLLTTEVKGGEGRINAMMQQMEVFISDHHYSSPGMPFQSLVTDRIKEADSSKWITKLYYPIM